MRCGSPSRSRYPVQISLSIEQTLRRLAVDLAHRKPPRRKPKTLFKLIDSPRPCTTIASVWGGGSTERKVFVERDRSTTHCCEGE